MQFMHSIDALTHTYVVCNLDIVSTLKTLVIVLCFSSFLCQSANHTELTDYEYHLLLCKKCKFI